jgi:CspA family cold shock protein
MNERGTVIWFNASKGFGFLKRQGKSDIFVHHSGIDMEGYRTLKEGQTVEFDVEDGREGRQQAVNVRPLD